jgi:N-dimethylarginine dimethylaminohydrolase
MAKKSRKYEVAGIFPLIREFSGQEPDVLIPPEGCLLEGGDILVDKGRILVGISQRTNMRGYEWLRDTFDGQAEVIPINIKSQAEGENVLHLDCAFNPVGEKSALFYEDGFASFPEFLKREYDMIPVSKKEQRELATNVLSLSEKMVIARDHPECKRLSEAMHSRGIEVAEIRFDGAPSTGGSFRCCSLPLIRG